MVLNWLLSEVEIVFNVIEKECFIVFYCCSGNCFGIV